MNEITCNRFVELSNCSLKFFNLFQVIFLLDQLIRCHCNVMQVILSTLPGSKS